MGMSFKGGKPPTSEYNSMVEKVCLTPLKTIEEQNKRIAELEEKFPGQKFAVQPDKGGAKRGLKKPSPVDVAVEEANKGLNGCNGKIKPLTP